MQCLFGEIHNDNSDSECVFPVCSQLAIVPIQLFELNKMLFPRCDMTIAHVTHTVMFMLR